MSEQAEAIRVDPRPLGIVATLGWVVAAFVLAQAVGLAAMAMLPDSGASASEQYDGGLIAVVTLVTNPVLILVMMAAARRAGGGPFAYLGLVGFKQRDLAIGIALIAIMIVAVDLFGYVAGLETVSPFQLQAYASARREGWLILLGLAVIVVGPFGEEIMFRGFLWRGWVRPGPWGVIAVVLITLAWAGLHFQYDLFGVSQVFLLGLVLAWMRWRSDSTTLVFILHALLNAESTVETYLKLGSSQ